MAFINFPLLRAFISGPQNRNEYTVVVETKRSANEELDYDNCH